VQDDLNTLTAQQLHDTDKMARAEFCTPLINILNTDPDILYKLTSDEAQFRLSGYVNKQNFRNWNAERPTEVYA
jgi:hypothetical protein